jgi:methionyl-tRNA synthetase
MIAKNCAGAVPTPGAFTDADTKLLDGAKAMHDKVASHFDLQAFHRGLEAIWAVVGDANRYVDEQAPWVLRKTDPARMATVLYVLAETVRHIAILAQPVMPDAMARMLDQLGVAPDARDFSRLGGAGALSPGTSLPKPSGVFPRFVEAEEEEAGANNAGR